MAVRKITAKISNDQKSELCVVTPNLDNVLGGNYWFYYFDFQKRSLGEWKNQLKDIVKEHMKEAILGGEKLSAKESIFEEAIKPEILRIEYIIKEGGLLRLKDGSGIMMVLYKGAIYKFDRYDYSDQELLLQILDFEDKERRKFERLKRKFELSQQMEKAPKRETIPEEVRIAVWRRDEGKCSKCGSRKNLEYDHIIPISKGGSNTVRNIELLCEECNRRKKDNIQ